MCSAHLFLYRKPDFRGVCYHTWYYYPLFHYSICGAKRLTVSVALEPSSIITWFTEKPPSMQRRRRNLGGTVPENPGMKVDVTMAFNFQKKIEFYV